MSGATPSSRERATDPESTVEGAKPGAASDGEPSTDRRLAAPNHLEDLAWDDRGLVPVVVQDVDSGWVLMVAWANREALERTLATGEVHFWSRSRRELWRKGETSGNVLHLRSLHADCDADTVLALVSPTGPACHTGETSCFGRESAPTAASAAGRATGAPRSEPDANDTASRGARAAGPSHADVAVLAELWSVIDARAAELPEGSYTTKLLKDENLRLKKLGEETAELVTALAKSDPGRSAEEAADLLYHLLAALRGGDVPLDRVLEVLAERRR